MPLLDVARQVAQQRVRELVLVSVLVQQQELERPVQERERPVQELEPVRLLVRVLAAQELVLTRRLLHRRLQ
ncbi:MAG: hypothetical protein RIS58_383 [Actinomycetota bacterium]